MTFRCILMREKVLQKQNNCLGLIKSAEIQNVIVPPNSVVTLSGYIDKELPYHSTPAMFHPSHFARDYKDYDVEPSLVTYQHKQNGPLTVKINNITTRTISIPPKAIVCELQPVTLETTPDLSSEQEIQNILGLMEFEKSDLSDEQLEEGIHLIRSYMDIFSKTDEDVGHTDV